jgi:SAM-dependent methyltransferase
MPEAVPCPGCSGGRFETIFEDCSDLWLRIPGEYPVVRCLECGLVQTNPRPTPEELEAFYPEEYAPAGCPTPDRPMGRTPLVRAFRWVIALPYRLRWGREFVSRLVPGRVLDVGAGNGFRLARLEGRGWEPWILEPRAETARETAGRLGIPEERVVVAYAEDADLPAGHFDLVVMDHTVEHLSDPRAVFDSISRLLKGGGRLLITCPNYGSLESRLFGRWWMGLDMPRHLTHFGAGTLERMAAESGLEMEDIRPQYGTLVMFSVVFRHAFAKGLDGSPGAKTLPLPERLVAFALEQLATVAQAFGYMPMMEVVFRKPPASVREEA